MRGTTPWKIENAIENFNQNYCFYKPITRIQLAKKKKDTDRFEEKCY